MKKVAIASIGLVSPAWAGEHTVEKKDFEVAVTCEAQVIPIKRTGIKIQPRQWGDYTIRELVAQGTFVKKGQALIVLKTEALDKEIKKVELDMPTRKANLDKVMQELLELEVSTRRKLAAAKQKWARLQQDYKYATDVTIPVAKKNAERDVENAKIGVEYAKEELSQLLKMYKEDAITEETEEIILKRAKLGLKRATERLEEVERNTRHKLRVALPRDKENWDFSLKSGELEWKSVEKSLPRALILKREAVDKERRTFKEWMQHLDKLKHDRKQMNIVAPHDGIVYYGSFEKGFWNTGLANKVLVPGGKLPGVTTVMTVVAKQSPVVLTAFVNDRDRAALVVDSKGLVTAYSSPMKRFSATVEGLGAAPTVRNNWKVDFSTQVPQGVLLQPGNKAKVKVITYSKEQSLVVPNTALYEQADGTFNVRLKMADGKTQDKPVQVGRANGSQVEILSGIEAGQVVLTK